ncbi:MAG: hypothetical protein ACRCYR_03490 [Phycicoccus sp.]
MTDVVRTAAGPGRTRRAGVLRLVGALGMCAGALGAAHAVLLVAYRPSVAESAYSFPFRPAGFVASQAVLTARDLALAGLLTGLLATPLARGVVARLGLLGSAVSMLVLAALEIVSAAAVTWVDLGGWYGLASFGVGLSLIVTGIAAARTSVLSPWLRFLPLTIGLYVFVVLTPGILAGFTVGQLAIGGWMLLFAGLGLALLTTSTGPARPQHSIPEAT